MGKGTLHVPTSTNMVMNPSQNGNMTSSIKFQASYFRKLCLKISKESKQLVLSHVKKNGILRTMNRLKTERSSGCQVYRIRQEAVCMLQKQSRDMSFAWMRYGLGQHNGRLLTNTKRCGSDGMISN